MTAAPKKIQIALVLSCVAAFVMLLSNAWVADDAFITFRVVYNAVHGYGLRWNPDERVQVYTHPLWMLAHIPLYAAFGNIFLVTIGFSLLLSMLALWKLLTLPASPSHKLVLLVLPFALSKTLHDHLVSGLEAPMVIFLLAMFWRELLTRQRKTRLTFIASLAMLARLDTAVLLALPLLHVFKSGRGRGRALLAAWPLAAWFGFSLLYYGFLFPNTKYAKLNTGVDFHDYLTQGAYYVRDFASYDIFSALLGVGVLVTVCALILLKKPVCELATLNAFGIILYISYVMVVGGDFMLGRFLAAPVFMSILLLAQLGGKLAPAHMRVLACLMGVAAIVHLGTYVPRDIDAIMSHHGIADEREYYKTGNALFPPGSFIPRTEVISALRDKGEAASQEATNGVIEFSYTGVYGFYAGPQLTIIDDNALSDPLLARLPIPDPKVWRIGHFERVAPAGYLQARQTGDTSAMEEPLRSYYEALRRVTSAPLIDEDRLRTILDFQLGKLHP